MQSGSEETAPYIPTTCHDTEKPKLRSVWADAECTILYVIASPYDRQLPMHIGGYLRACVAMLVTEGSQDRPAQRPWNVS
jgi:hypothetical protein